MRIPLLLVALAACASPARYRAWSYAPPVETGDGWVVGHADDHEIDVETLETMTRGLADDGFVQMRSMLLIRDGVLVYEVYDRPSRAAHLQDLRSTTKSITGLLVTEASRRGLLDLDAPVLPHLTATPGAFDEAWQTTSWRHLLTMRSGLACDDQDPSSPGQEEKMYRSRDWVAFWLDLPRLDAPGETGRYCTGNVVALGRALAAAVGEPVDAWARRVLFDPIGLDTVRWATFAGSGGLDTGGHLRMRPRDLARIGQLVLDDGAWDGVPVLSEGTVADVTTAEAPLRGSDYGLLWWLSSFETEQGETVHVWETRGNGGQHIFVLPELELVAVFTGHAYNHADAALPYALMGRFVLPAAGITAVEADDATPANP